MDQAFPYHSISFEETIEKLETSSEKGLSNDEAKKRLQKFGENKLPEKGKTSIWKLILKQFKDFLVL
ncbi:MAG: cation-transporting P-type ATPase, partial [Bacteroidota bacterium]